jgi:phosphotransferase system IIB component
VRVRLLDATRIDVAAIESAGAQGVMPIDDSTIHVIVGAPAAAWGAAIGDLVAGRRT